MPNFKNVLSLFTFKNKAKMDQAGGFNPTDTFASRYNNADVLTKYLKEHPDGFRDDQFEIRDLDNTLQLRLTRKLTAEERDAVLAAFRKARRQQKRKTEDESSG